jgi:hypothetical protein
MSHVERSEMFECDSKWLPVSRDGIEYFIVWFIEMKFLKYISNIES